MKFATTAKWLHTSSSWRVWLLISAAAALVLLIVNAASRCSSKGMAVDIVINTNGIPTVLGVPLGNGAVRDIALRTFGRAKVHVSVLTPSGGSGAPGFDTNWIQAMQAVIKAGLVPTNGPSGPSPYE
jgi:hypothetical protein